MKKPIKLHKPRSVFQRFSFQALAAGAALQTCWIALPPSLVDAVPDEYRLAIVVLILVAGVVGSFVDQNIEE